jgi:hypothetical protein
MRITLAIDDDVLDAARHLAEREHKSLGEVVSSLARMVLTGGTGSARRLRNGVLLLARRTSITPVTLELINQFHDEKP